ncbi:MAG: InlB B-repeat-containing protein, partial [Oscillospiraceae bacterium]|nr:InlB B-repeat-containing protein [Oscillospiraceae bacterium]
PSGKLNLDEGVIFKGWTTNPDYSVADAANALDIGEVRTEVSGMLPPDSDGDEIIYYAMLYKKYTVTYLDTKEAAIHQDSILYRADATGNDLKQDYVVSWNYTPEDDTHDFEGWFVNEGGNNIEGFDASANEGKGTLYEYEQDITISGDVTFSVFAPEGHWLVFDENGKGATYNAPQFVKAGENTRAPSLDMVRNGYTFGGWYYFPNNDAPEPDATTKEVDLTNATLFSFGGTLSERTTIYAKWTPITDAAYTVIIWKQNLAGNGYDFVEAVPKNGRVGTTPNAVRNNGSVDGARYNGETGFSFNNTDQASKVIAPEGNTVVNVYYNRNSYTWTFQDYTYTQNTRGEYVYWPGGYYRTGTYNYTYYYYPEGYYSRDNYNGTDEDTYGVGPSPVYNVSNNATVTYYTKNTNGTYSSHTYTAHRYNRSSNRTTIKTITALYGQNISDQFPITGSNGITYDDGQRWTPVNTQIVTQTIVSQETMPAGNATFYMNAGTKRPLKTMNYYVEALPGDTNTVNYLGVDYVLYNTITARYNRVTETEDFFDIDGFRKVTSNPEFVNGVALNDSDSDGTINLYYSRKVYSLNFMDGSYFDGNGNRITTETSSGHIHDVGNIPYGSDLTSYNKNGADYYIPTAPEGYVFEGWYIDSACSAQSPFTFNTMPEGGITVYAKWRQIQYRVFLHPNAGTDQSLDWGSDSQEMNFRVSYGGKVSAPTGRRTGYNFIGWYLDKDCTKVFSDSLVLNDSSVTTPYDKENHFTEGMNKWGTGATSNGDLDRFWITKEFNLYGKWSKVLEGADGINVVYSLRDPDAGTGSGSAVDNNVYVDNSNATAAAAVNAPEGYRFAYWIVQDYENGAYVDTDTHVYAGGNFSVLEENAKKEGTGEYVKDKDDNYLDANGNITTDPSKYVEIHVYTVQLRAKYVRAEDAVPTHIYWYKNDGTAGPIHEDPAEDQTLEINEGVGIQAAPERDGYDFVGWAKVNEPSDPSTYAPEDVTGTMLLYYDEEHGFTSDAAHENAASQVAADEDSPIEALVAVWKEKDVTIHYAVAGDSQGYNGVSVSETEETIKAATGTPKGSTASSTNTTYIFDHWTVDDGEESISSDATYVPQKNKGVYEEHTYYAHFKLNKAAYTIHHYLNGTTIKVADDQTGTEVIGQTVTATAYQANAEALYDNYKTVVHTSFVPTSGGVVITENASTNEIIVYYMIPLTITVGDKNAEYNGSVQYGYGADLEDNVTVSGLLTGDSISDLKYTQASGKDVGVYNGKFTADPVVTNESGSVSYYKISKTAGKLNITKNKTEIVITADSGEKTYDGKALVPTQGADGTGEDAGYTYTQGVLAEGDELVVEVSGSQTDAGTSASKVESYKVVRKVEGEDGEITEKDVTSYYTFGESVDGTL